MPLSSVPLLEQSPAKKRHFWKVAGLTTAVIGLALAVIFVCGFGEHLRPATSERQDIQFELGPQCSAVTPKASDVKMYESFSTLVDMAVDLYNCYFPGAQFPMLSLDMLKANAPPPGSAYKSFKDFMESTVVYYKVGADLNLVQRLATEREPTNIGMGRYYDQNLLYSSLGWRTGAYAESTRSKLMPEIAVYTETPVWIEQKQEWARIHLVNIILPAFDSQDQPDYKYFLGGERSFSNFTSTKKWAELVARTRDSFRFIFVAAISNGLRKVREPFHGRRRFFHEYLKRDLRDDSAGDKLTAAAFDPLQEEFKDRITVEKMDSPNPQVWALPAGDLDDVLFVNSWDPWAIVGNGNCIDESTDGHYGRSSAVALLSWPKTNPFLTYCGVDTDIPGKSGSRCNAPSPK